MADDDLSGLLNIGLDFTTDSEPDEAANPNTTTTTTNRTDRNVLSEADFQSLKQSYHVKLENGEIHKTITLPLPQSTTIAKPEAQEILHAVEELYFFRRYAEGVDFVRRVIGDGGDNSNYVCPLDGETKSLLKYYGEKCEKRVVRAV